MADKNSESENESKPWLQTAGTLVTVGAVLGTAGFLMKYGRVTDTKVKNRSPSIPNADLLSAFNHVELCPNLTQKPVEPVSYYYYANRLDQTRIDWGLLKVYKQSIYIKYIKVKY